MRSKRVQIKSFTLVNEGSPASAFVNIRKLKAIVESSPVVFYQEDFVAATAGNIYASFDLFFEMHCAFGADV